MKNEIKKNEKRIFSLFFFLLSFRAARVVVSAEVHRPFARAHVRAAIVLTTTV